VLAPTRELALQIYQETRRLAQGTGVSLVPVFGGVNKHQQRRALQRGCHVVVATPGRLADHVLEGNCSLHLCSFVVLGEGREREGRREGEETEREREREGGREGEREL
jgi:ATP-dependent RNA helicase DeaD